MKKGTQHCFPENETRKILERKSWILRKKTEMWYGNISLTIHLLTYLLTDLFTFLLSPWSRVLLEKMTGSQLVNKFPAFYGNRGFITAFTTARHLSVSWTRLYQRISLGPNGTCIRFVTRKVFTMRSCQHLAQQPSWSTTPCRLSATAYLIYSQVPSILGAVPLSATWGRAMPWSQGTAYHDFTTHN